MMKTILFDENNKNNVIVENKKLDIQWFIQDELRQRWKNCILTNLKLINH